MSDKMNKELNEVEIDQIIDEEIGSYLEENSMGGGAMAFAPGAVKEEEVDEGRRGRHIDPHAHKFNRKKPDPHFIPNPRDRANPIPKQLHRVSKEADWEAFTGQTGGEVCSLKFGDVPSTFPQGHPKYDGKPTDPETGMPASPVGGLSMTARGELHKWMCSNPKSKPIPITAKKPAKGRYDAAGTPVRRPLAPDDDFDRYIDEGVERPKGISLRVTTPDTLDEI